MPILLHRPSLTLLRFLTTLDCVKLVLDNLSLDNKAQLSNRKDKYDETLMRFWVDVKERGEMSLEDLEKITETTTDATQVGWTSTIYACTVNDMCLDLR